MFNFLNSMYIHIFLLGPVLFMRDINDLPKNILRSLVNIYPKTGMIKGWHLISPLT